MPESPQTRYEYNLNLPVDLLIQLEEHNFDIHLAAGYNIPHWKEYM